MYVHNKNGLRRFLLPFLILLLVVTRHLLLSISRYEITLNAVLFLLMLLKTFKNNVCCCKEQFFAAISARPQVLPMLAQIWLATVKKDNYKRRPQTLAADKGYDAT
jgi:hypothetical protein